MCDGDWHWIDGQETADAERAGNRGGMARKGRGYLIEPREVDMMAMEGGKRSVGK